MMTTILVVCALFAISVALYWSVIPSKHRSLFLLLCSVIFMASFGLTYALYFLLQVGFVYVAGLRIRRATVHRTSMLQLMLLWLVGHLCFFKYTTALMDTLLTFGIAPSSSFPSVPTILLPLGASYITFRLIHYIVEVYRHGVPKSSFVDMANYVLFFPTFLAGPVERFPAFHAQTQALGTLQRSDVNNGLFRILKGLIKKTAIADPLAAWVLPIIHAPDEHARIVVACAVYASLIRIYLDFSAYTDIAIGASRLLGYRIMENFNAPLLAQNLAVFWRRWHISVYSFIRDYFFFPLFGHRASRIKLYFGIFASMMVFHLWHGASMAFLSMGLYFGVALMLWQFVQDIKRRQPQVAAILDYPPLRPLHTIATLTCVSIGALFVTVDFSTGLHALRRLSHG